MPKRKDVILLTVAKQETLKSDKVEKELKKLLFLWSISHPAYCGGLSVYSTPISVSIVTPDH